MTSIPVTIMLPTKTNTERWCLSLVRLGGLALQAYVLMLILGTLTDLGVSYWHSVLVIIGWRALQRPDTYLEWTKMTPEKKES